MSAYFLKTILGAVFLAAALTSFLSMMTLMGKPEKKTDPAKLIKIHRAAGIFITILLVPLIYLGARFLGQMGDAMSIRSGFHVVLAIAFVVLLILKIAIVRVYRNFLKHAPVLGMMIFILAVIVFAISAGFTVLMNIF
jgi:predicted membrane protein